MATVSTQTPPAAPSAPTAGPAPAERRVAAWVGSALRIEGRIVSSADLSIDGSVEGSIEVGERGLNIGAGASVKADLTARTITIQGDVIGNVRASERVELHATGSVIGDISAPHVVLAEGAAVKGRIEAGPRQPRRD